MDKPAAVDGTAAENGTEEVTQEFVDQQRLLNKIREDVIAAGTRAVHGRGGLVEQLLFGSEFISVAIKRLPEDFTEVQLHNLAAKYGQLRYVKMVHEDMGNAVYRTTTDAASAVAALKREKLQGKYLAAWPHAPVPLSPITCSLRLSWALTSRTNMVHLAFPSAEIANRAFTRIREVQARMPFVNKVRCLGRVPGAPPHWNLSPHRLSADGKFIVTPEADHAADSEGVGAGSAAEASAGDESARSNVNPLRSLLKVYEVTFDIPATFRGFIDEVSIEQALPLTGRLRPLYVRVMREAPRAAAGAAAGDSGSGGGAKRFNYRWYVTNEFPPHLRELRPHDVHYMPGRAPQQLERAVITYESADQCREVLQYIKQRRAEGVKPTVSSWNGSAVRLQELYSCRIPLPANVAAALKHELQRVIATVRAQYNTNVIVEWKVPRAADTAEAGGDHNERGDAGVAPGGDGEGEAAVSAGACFVRIRLESRHVHELLAARNALNKTCLGTEFRSPESSMLFTTLGINELQNLERAHPCIPPPLVGEAAGAGGGGARPLDNPEAFFLLPSLKRKSVFVYGSPAARERAMLLLHDIVRDVSRVYVREEMHILASNRALFQASRKELQIMCGVDSVSLMGVKVVAMGNKENVAKLKKQLGCMLVPDAAAAAALPTPPDANGSTGAAAAADDSGVDADSACCVCMCELDSDRYQLRACGHWGCFECIKLMFRGAETGDTERLLPVKCPKEGCGELLTNHDIFAVAPAAGYANLAAAAVNKFIMESGGRYRRCALPGCDQVVSTPQDKSAATSTQPCSGGSGAVGSVVYCDCCCVSYCHTCTAHMKKRVPPHKGGLTCEVFRAQQSPAVQAHVDHVLQDIFTTKCPRCKAPFVDFDGCFALTCGNGACSAHFCAYCLTTAANSDECHQHVQGCKLGNGSYFNTAEAFRKVHRARMQEEARSYLRSIAVEETRMAVEALVQPHARALQVEL